MPFSPSLNKAKNVKMVVQCEECLKWRVFYAARSLKSRQRLKLKKNLDVLSYSCGASLKTRKILFLNMFSLTTNLPVIHLLKYLITLYLTTLYVTIVEVSTICLLFLRTTCSVYAMNVRHSGSLQGRRVADNSKKKAKPICVNFLYKNC